MKTLIQNGEQEALQLLLELRDFALYQFCQSLLQGNAWPQALEVIPIMQTTLFIVKMASECRQAVVAFSEALIQAGEEEDAVGWYQGLDRSDLACNTRAIATFEGIPKATALNVFGESLMQAHHLHINIDNQQDSAIIILLFFPSKKQIA